MPCNNICRLCLCETPITFSLLKNNTHKMLETLTSIKLKPTDSILMVCLKCNLNLKLAYNIQQNIIQANEKLKKGLLNNDKCKKEIIKTEETIICDNVVVKTDDVNSVQLCDSCVICDLVLDENSMNSHIRQHFNDTQSCDLCDETFCNIQDYKQHLLSHPNKMGYQCKICDKKFYYKSFYNLHLERAHSDVTVLKNTQTVSKAEKLKESAIHVKKIKKYKTTTEKIKDLQKKGMSTKLARQLASLSDVKQDKRPDPCSPYTCNICLKKFLLKNQFRNHNHRRKPCPICKKDITADNFSKHVKNHTSGPQMCEQCGKTYTNMESLRGHIFYQHRNKHYECQECNITFKNRQGLNGHKKREHLGTGHVCETCGRKFVFSYDLKKHIMMTHLKLRPYVCEFCKRGFSGLHAMKTHRRQHTNETPYRCEVCGDGFRQNVSLKAHRKSKHNIIEAVTCACKICGKGFSSMHAVKAHMRCH